MGVGTQARRGRVSNGARRRRIRAVAAALGLGGLLLAAPAQAAGPSPWDRATTTSITGGLPPDTYVGVAALSATGRYVAFERTTASTIGHPSANRLDVRDRLTGTAQLLDDVPAGEGGPEHAVLSANGRVVATTVMLGCEPGCWWSTTVFDTWAGTSRRLDLDNHPRRLDDLSGDGSTALVMFSGTSSDDWETYGELIDVATGRAKYLTLPSGEPDPSYVNGALSADGRLLLFTSSSAYVADDLNRTRDAYLRDLLTGTTRRVSVGYDVAGSPKPSEATDLSPDGRFAVFTSYRQLTPGDSNRRPDVYLRDLVTRQTTLVSSGVNGQAVGGGAGRVSADGRFVAFASRDGSLSRGDVNRDWDVFVRDLYAGTTRLVSVATSGHSGDRGSRLQDFSRDGRHVAFYSEADDLVPSDTNGRRDVFVRDVLAD